VSKKKVFRTSALLPLDPWSHYSVSSCKTKNWCPHEHFELTSSKRFGFANSGAKSGTCCPGCAETYKLNYKHVSEHPVFSRSW